jgi:hypothetical protein
LSRDEVDEELAKDNQGEEAAETTQNTKYTLITHTCAKNDQGEEADETKQDAKYTPTTHTCIKNKIPNQFAMVSL